MSLATIDLTQDDGFATVDVPGGGSVHFDLYAVHDKLIDAGRANKDNAEGYAAAVRAVMDELGLPSVSQRLMWKFVGGVFDAVKQLGNLPGEAGDAATPASPAFTGPVL